MAAVATGGGYHAANILAMRIPHLHLLSRHAVCVAVRLLVGAAAFLACNALYPHLAAMRFSRVSRDNAARRLPLSSAAAQRGRATDNAGEWMVDAQADKGERYITAPVAPPAYICFHRGHIFGGFAIFGAGFAAAKC